MRYRDVIFLLALGASQVAALSITSVVPAESLPKVDGLNSRFVAKGKKFWGSYVTLSGIIPPSTNLTERIAADLGAISEANAFKWDATEPTRGTFIFASADRLINWATSNGKLVAWGGPLVWHSQLPSWVSSISDGASLTAVIQNHINSVAGRYSRKWTVVTEAINEDGSLRSSVFSRVLGENFVTIAFRAARAADPSAILYISDYNIDVAASKLNGLINLVKRINTNGPLIQGIGFDVHTTAGNTGGLAGALALAANLNVSLALSAVDISGGTPTDWVALTKACLDQPKCESITTSNLCDSADFASRVTTALFDEKCAPKPAYTAVMNLLAGA